MGAVVTAERLGGSTWSIDGLVNSTTNSDGKYQLLGLPKGDGHVLKVYPPLDQPYFITDGLKVSAGVGLEALKYDIALKRGVWITGRASKREAANQCGRWFSTIPYSPMRPRLFSQLSCRYALCRL